MKFFKIDEFIAPKVIEVLWIIGIIGAAITLLIGFIGGLISGKFLSAILFLIGVPISLLIYRVYLEIIMVLFKIEKNTK